MTIRQIALSGLDVQVEEGWNSCVHCGYCCQQGRCSVSRALYPEADGGRCPALMAVENDSGLTLYLCKHAGTHSAELAIGEGCCSALNSKRVPYLLELGIVVPKRRSETGSQQ